MTEFFRLLFAPCESISRLTSESLDRPLPRTHRVAVTLHMLYCRACRRYRRQIVLIREALHQMIHAEAGAGLPTEAGDRMKAVLRENRPT